MPNASKTPNRTFRIPEDLWEDVQRIAKSKGLRVTTIVVGLLTKYVEENKVVYGDWQ